MLGVYVVGRHGRNGRLSGVGEGFVWGLLAQVVVSDTQGGGGETSAGDGVGVVGRVAAGGVGVVFRVVVVGAPHVVQERDHL